MDEFITLKDLKDANLSNQIGRCSDSTAFLSSVNEAIRRLMTRGDWSQTVVPIHMCVRRGCVTWPRFVGQIRRLKICGRPIPMTNLYCSYLERDDWPCWYSFPSLHSWGAYRSESRNWGPCGATQLGRYSTYADPQGTRYIRAYPQFPADVGKTVTVFGKDENGQPLIHENADGTHSPGLIITIANPFGSSAIQIQTPIDRVIKDQTDGQVWLYAYNADLDELEDIAVYQPSEKNPSYARHNIPGCPNTENNRGVMALVKLKHIDLVDDTDLVLVPSLAAIKFMLQSIVFEESNDAAMGAEYEAKAIRELNLQLRDEMPEQQTAVVIEPFNGTGIGTQQIF
jgi:hypothetical protein